MAWKAALGGTLAASLFATAAGAGGQAAPGLVVNVLTQVSGAGQFFFSQTGTTTGHPACATAPRSVVSLATPGGQALASTVLTAYATGKSIIVLGTGACADWPDTESVLYIQTQ